MPGLPTDEIPEETDRDAGNADKAEPSAGEQKPVHSYYYDDAHGYRDYDPGEEEDDPEEAEDDARSRG